MTNGQHGRDSNHEARKRCARGDWEASDPFRRLPVSMISSRTREWLPECPLGPACPASTRGARPHCHTRSCPTTPSSPPNPLPPRPRPARRPAGGAGAAGALPPAGRRAGRGARADAAGRARSGTWTTSTTDGWRRFGSFPAPSPSCPSSSSTCTRSPGPCTTRCSGCPSSTSPTPRCARCSASIPAKTSGSGPAGLRPCRRAIRSSTGWTAWWTTPARSGRTPSASSSRTSPASAGCTWCRRSRRWWTRSIVPLLVVARSRASSSAACSTPGSCCSRSWCEHLEVLGRPGGTICLIEPKYELEGIDEQRRLVEYYADRHGIRMLHADPSELHMRGDEVYCGDHQVDLVYRDYAVMDLVELAAEGMDPEPMRRLFRENRVVSSITCGAGLQELLRGAHRAGAEREVLQRGGAAGVPAPRALDPRGAASAGPRCPRRDAAT